MKIRILSFICTFLILTNVPFWFAVPFVFAYVLAFPAYELLALSVSIDTLFGNSSLGVGYQYTILIVTLLILTSFIKPYLKMYA